MYFDKVTRAEIMKINILINYIRIYIINEESNFYHKEFIL